MGHLSHIAWYTVGVLSTYCTRKTMGKLAGKSLNVLMVYQASMSPVHCPFPYSVLSGTWIFTLFKLSLLLVYLSFHLTTSMIDHDNYALLFCTSRFNLFLCSPFYLSIRITFQTIHTLSDSISYHWEQIPVFQPSTL